MFKNIFSKISESMGSIRDLITDVAAEEQVIEEEVPELSNFDKQFTNYNIDDLFPFKLYTCQKDDTLEDVCKLLNADPKIIIKTNNLENRTDDLFPEQRLLIPSIFMPLEENFQSELTLQDIRDLDVETIMAANSELATFYCYYKTVAGDILGKLTFTDQEMMFNPLNEKFKGYFRYNSGNLVDNVNMAFSVCFNDIISKPMKVPTPNIEERSLESLSMDYNIQFDVVHTGYYYFADDEAKKIIDEKRVQKQRLATFALKISNRTLLNEPQYNSKKDSFAQMIIDRVELGMSNAEKLSEQKSYSITILPYFDIAYEHILLDGNRTRYEIKVKHVEENFGLLYKLFGYKKGSLTAIIHINNQSYFDLENTFPELKKEEFLEKRPKTIIEEIDQKQKNQFIHRVVYKSLEEVPNNNLNLLTEKSDLIDEKFAYSIDHYFPGYLRKSKWYLYYNTAKHGTSYRALQENCAKKGECLIIIRESGGNLFGGFMDCALEKRDGFYGYGNCFLYKLNKNDLVIYRSSKENTYYINCTDEGIGMGGDPYSGIYIENSLFKGYSHHCKTYFNDQLSENKFFKITKIEVWGFKKEKDYDS